MGKIPTSVNIPLKTTEDIISFGVYNVALAAAEAALTVEFPVLATPVAKEIFDLAMKKIATELYLQLADIAVITFINFETDQEESAYSAAEGNLRQAMLSGDKNEIAKASQNFNDTLDSLVHFDGSVPT